MVARVAPCDPVQPSSPASRPAVSVVVPVRDGADALDRCLSALAAQDYPRELLDVVVVDNRSTEDVAAVVAGHPGVVLLREPEGGSYAARNTGLAASRGEVLAFTDADCAPAPGWVSAAVAELARDPRAAMVGGAVELTFRHGRPVTACELLEAVQAFPQQRYLERYRFAATANMVTWRETLRSVGPFDPQLLSGGDHEWGGRVAAAGGEQRDAAAAVVGHPARSGWPESVRKWRRVAQGRATAARRERRVRFHLVRSVWREVRSAALELGRSAHHPQLTTTAARVRYLAAHTACRAVTAAVLARALVATLRPRRR